MKVKNGGRFPSGPYPSSKEICCWVVSSLIVVARRFTQIPASGA